MNRRKFVNLATISAIGATVMPSIRAIDSKKVYNISNDHLPLSIPDNLKKMIEKTLTVPFREMTTNWDGSIQVEGLLRFAERGHRKSLDYAKNWFQYRLETDAKMTDEEYFGQWHTRARARIDRSGPLTFSVYSANLGVAFPVYDLYKLTHNETARTVCIDVADAILHKVARDKYGMVAHDDNNFTRFAIPDTTYWATRASAIAGKLTLGELSEVYYKQAIFQLDQGIDIFLDGKNGLVRTVLLGDKIGKTYWSRSQGWLLWSIVGLLRYLPESHPRFEYFSEKIRKIADAVQKHQGKNGGLHVLVDDRSTPEEVSGMAMCLSALKESVRNGWIPDNYSEFFEKGFSYIKNSVDDNGNIRNVYTGWAIPAEERKTDIIDKTKRGWAPGILMVATDEMTKS